MVILVILAILLTYVISNLIRISNASVGLIFIVSYGVAGFIIWRLGKLYPTLKIEIQKPREGIGIKIFKEIVLPLIIAVVGGFIIYYVSQRS